METLVEQFAISAASVRIETGKTTVWASGDFGCLPPCPRKRGPQHRHGGLIKTNARIDLPADVHVDIKDATTPTDLLCLNKNQAALWVAFHMQEAATEVGVNQLAESVDDQYLVKLKQEYVGYKNQTPLTIINHLYHTWVKFTNADKVAALVLSGPAHPNCPRSSF